MRVLDRTRPFGKISPPMDIDGTDTTAHYDQDGILFDAHDRPCRSSADEPVDEPVALVVTPGAAVPVVSPVNSGANVEVGVVASVVASPRKQRIAQRAAAQASAPKPEAISAPPPPANPVIDGIDLAAWGRGKKDYLFGDIRKAVRKAYHATLTERRDVVDLLIEQRVITSAEARTDV